MSATTHLPPEPVRDEEMTPALARLDRLMIRVTTLQRLLDAGRLRDARVMLAGGPCDREFDVNYRTYLRNALVNGAVEVETARLEDGMDRAFTELAAGGDMVRARECLDRRRDPSIPLLRRPELAEDPRSFALDDAAAPPAP